MAWNHLLKRGRASKGREAHRVPPALTAGKPRASGPASHPPAHSPSPDSHARDCSVPSAGDSGPTLMVQGRNQSPQRAEFQVELVARCVRGTRRRPTEAGRTLRHPRWLSSCQEHPARNIPSGPTFHMGD